MARKQKEKNKKFCHMRVEGGKKGERAGGQKYELKY